MSESLPSLLMDFSPPLSWNNNSISSIELHEPKAADVVKAQVELTGKPDSTIRYGIALICAVCGQPRQIIEQMPISQLMRGITYLMDFLNGGPATGES